MTSIPEPRPEIPDMILVLRGQRVMLDADLASIYGVTTKVLNQAVKRNAERFPEDFMFRLTEQEREEVVTSCDHLARLKYSRTPPYAFTQEGVAMLAGVLKSERAIQVHVEILGVFVRLRREALAYAEISRRLDSLEAKYDGNFALVFDAIRALIESPASPDRLIGLRVCERAKRYRVKTAK